MNNQNSYQSGFIFVSVVPTPSNELRLNSHITVPFSALEILRVCKLHSPVPRRKRFLVHVVHSWETDTLNPIAYAHEFVVFVLLWLWYQLQRDL